MYGMDPTYFGNVDVIGRASKIMTHHCPSDNAINLQVLQPQAT